MPVYDVSITFRVAASSYAEATDIAEGQVKPEADTVTEGVDLVEE